jgi:protein-L-isoaspartate O-methyltransferase
MVARIICTSLDVTHGHRRPDQLETPPGREARVTQPDPELFTLRPWYHDFSALGFDTTFLDVPLTLGERVHRAGEVVRAALGRVWGRARTSPVPRERARSAREVLRRLPSPHLLNQPVKERHLLALVARALAGLGPRPTCLELFSADGYYSCRLKMLSPRARVTGVELDPEQVRRAETIARRLGLHEVSFRREDVWTFLERSSETYDLVLCAGGLYHLSDPARLLQAVTRVARGYLVVQSVVTLETEDPGYFVQPAKGWQHGCRFTHAWLRERLGALGWRIVEEARAELPGNRRPHDRGSSFFLCRAHPAASQR